MRRMTPETEARLTRGVENLTDLVNGGATPTEALLKVARDGDFLPGQIRLMASAYNTARSTMQREIGADTLEKAASFPVADARIVLEELYPTEVKSAAAQEQAVSVSSEYSEAPHWYRRIRSVQKMAKLAAPISLTDKPWEPPPRDPKEEARRVYNEKVAYQRHVEELRRQATALEDKLHEQFDKLASYFRSPANLPYADVRTNVEIMHGNEGSAVMRYLDAHLPKLAKRASSNPWHAVNKAAEPYASIDRVIKLAQDLLDARAAHAKAAEGLAAKEAAVYGEPPPSLLDGLVEKKAVGPAELAGVQGAVEVFKRSLPAQKSPEEQMQSQLRALSDPMHEQKIRQLQTQAMLQDLFLTDPVLKGYDPIEVAQSFNEISRMAPRLAGQPLAMSAMLRKRMQQGGFDPFEVSQMIDTEGKLRSTQGGRV